ncbi:uncharacterized protein N7459_002609 [Penicillium hispanicum]|uniref:uncharacterized protein n=1 Tax=Penicillium hispanicum TaxID=1080232 RepID=UPI002541B859|nr:uncharacterized protein N7459_002609 [Penicillium hispanicum]KAJ5586844.1 hypothetical protein N7459_002609 [Penicillium hispanicum]
MSSPGTHLTPGNNQGGRALTRQVNEDMSKICAEHTEYFDFFASLPLPNVEGSLVEIDYALDHLGAVGFQILTNSHGIYPGDERFRRVFDKLSQRNACVFFHPTSCYLQTATGASAEIATPMPGVPNPLMEFMFDTTRAVTSLLTSDTVQRCPGVTFLICHCGAALPPILARIAEFSSILVAGGKPMPEDEVKALLQTRFYFDLAGVPFPDQIHGMLRLVDTSRLLYGSDYPYTKAPLAQSLARRLDSGLVKYFSSETQKQVLLENAERLLSKLRSST